LLNFLNLHLVRGYEIYYTITLEKLTLLISKKFDLLFQSANGVTKLTI
jgi:hypothetical protein